MTARRRSLNSWPYPWVLVVWEDIYQTCEWTDNEGIKNHQPEICYTSGWLRENTPRVIKVASSLILGKTRKEDSSDVLSIPRGCILEVKLVKTNGTYKI